MHLQMSAAALMSHKWHSVATQKNLMNQHSTSPFLEKKARIINTKEDGELEVLIGRQQQAQGIRRKSKPDVEPPPE